MRLSNDHTSAPTFAHVGVAIAGALVTLLASPAFAGGQALTPASERCPSIFGTDDVRERNQERRSAKLHEVRSRQGKIELVHSVPKWDAPTQTSLPGMQVMEIDTDGIRIRVDKSYGKACPEGDYLLRVDDALGANGRVLAVLPTSFLIERDQSLAYLVPQVRRVSPSFRMVWRSNFVWVAQSQKGSATASNTRSVGTSPTSKATSRKDRKRRNEEARKRARARREKAKSPQSVIDSLPTTRLAKELRGGRAPPPKKK